MKAILTTYYGPTNRRGSRILATDGENRITLSYEPEWSHSQAHDAAALALCRKMKWDGALMCGEVKIRGKLHGVYVFDDPRNRVKDEQ